MSTLLREEDRVLFGTLYMAKLRLLRVMATGHCSRPCSVRVVEGDHDEAAIDPEGRYHCGFCPEGDGCSGLRHTPDPQELAWARSRVERLEVRAARIRREAK